jgi:hypothetical protein
MMPAFKPYPPPVTSRVGQQTLRYLYMYFCISLVALNTNPTVVTFKLLCGSRLVHVFPSGGWTVGRYEGTIIANLLVHVTHALCIHVYELYERQKRSKAAESVSRLMTESLMPEGARAEKAD